MFIRAVTAVLLGLVGSAVAHAETKAAEPHYVKADVTAGEAQVNAKVEAVDKANRILTLRDQDGKVRDIYVEPAIKGFDKVKKGDHIVANYKIAVAIALKKGGMGQKELIQTEASGPLANYETGRQVRSRTVVTATVESYDKATQTAVLKGPRGRTLEVKVKDPEVANQLKKGDQVVTVVSLSTAVALWPKEEVEAAQKASGNH